MKNLHSSISEIWPYFPHILSSTNLADGTKEQIIGSLQIFSCNRLLKVHATLCFRCASNA